MGDVASNRTRRLFLIRHGETVDNVAGVYGGVRDAGLTNHGFQQASRLASWLADGGVKFTHIFSSDLSRAFKTAQAILNAQPLPTSKNCPQKKLHVVALNELQEQNFGSLEGKSYHIRAQLSESRPDVERDPNFQEVESKQSLIKRADSFLLEYLMPALNDFIETGTPPVIAVVSHGVLLSTLWRCILSHQPANTVKLDPEVSSTLSPISIEHLGGWSNTGNLELELEELPKTEASESSGGDKTTKPGPATYTSSLDHEPALTAQSLAPEGQATSKFSILVKAVNRCEHLQGHKRARGGIGSAKHDENQKSIEAFLKRKRVN